MLGNNVQTHVYMGLMNLKTEKWNDAYALTKEGGMAKINAIKTFYNDKYVVALTIYYKLADGDILKAQHNAPEKGSRKLHRKLLEIGPDDYLIEISGHATEKGITRINFETYRGKTGSYGSDEGTPFIYKFPGHTFGPFAGGFKDHIVHLEIPICPVPKAFLDEFRPVKVNVTVTERIIVEEKNNPQSAVTVSKQTQLQGYYVNPNNNFAKVNFGQPNFAQSAFPMYQAPPPPPQQAYGQPQIAFVPATKPAPPPSNGFQSKYPGF